MLDDLDNSKEIALSVEQLLRVAEVNDRLPTPIDDLVAAAGLARTNEILLSESMIAKAPRHLRKLLKSAARKVVGVLDRRERVIQIAPNSSEGRQNFITCHEVSHDIFAWQRDLQVLGDTQLTLSRSVTDRFEREANQGAAELLFQLDLFRRVASDYPLDIATPIELAPLFGASIHATFRRWIEGLPSPACGLVLEPRPDRVLRRRYEHIDSRSWSDQFGPNRLPNQISPAHFAFAATVHGDGDLLLTDRAKDPVALRWQTFSTPYRTFALLWVPTTGSLVARTRRRATLIVPGN